MFTERDWLMKQEQINDQLRQRAEERAHPISDERRRRIDIKALASKSLFRRTVNPAGCPQPVGG